MQARRQVSPGGAGADARERVKTLYYIMQTMERNVGGGEGLQGLYGSVTRSGMQRILDCLAASCGLCSDSHLVDIGAGLGRPLLHALVSPGIAAGSGIELDRIKCDKAAPFLQRSLAALQRRLGEPALLPTPKVQCVAVEQVPSLGRATHAYSFWEGVPLEARAAFGRLFAATPAMQAVAVVQHAIRGRSPEAAMAELGFGRLTLAASFPVSMSGSGRSFTAYVFSKQPPGSSGDVGPAEQGLQPPTPAAAEKLPVRGESSGGAEEPPQTPAAARRAFQGQQQTPTSALRQRIAPSPHTPKSLGLSGPARRVPAAAVGAAASPAPSGGGSPAAAGRPPQHPGGSSSPAAAGLQPRRSARLAAAKPPGSPPGKGGGVQKVQKAGGSGLEAAGFRVRRVGGAGKVAKRVAELERGGGEPRVVARGLGAAPAAAR